LSAIGPAFARENGTARHPARSPAVRAMGAAHLWSGPAASASDIRVGPDFSLRPQNETTVAVNPWSPNMLIAGANDYRLGNPVAPCLHARRCAMNDGSPFPLLVATTKEHKLLQESPRHRRSGGSLRPGPRRYWWSHAGEHCLLCVPGVSGSFVSGTS
jgi:hypothetical protein